MGTRDRSDGGIDKQAEQWFRGEGWSRSAELIALRQFQISSYILVKSLTKYQRQWKWSFRVAFIFRSREIESASTRPLKPYIYICVCAPCAYLKSNVGSVKYTCSRRDRTRGERDIHRNYYSRCSFWAAIMSLIRCNSANSANLLHYALQCYTPYPLYMSKMMEIPANEISPPTNCAKTRFVATTCSYI